MKLNFRRGSAFASKKAKDFLQDKQPEDFKNITVIRHAAIGDFMNIRPFLINLRGYFPNAKITLSVDRNAMYGIPNDLIDNIHIIDKRNKKTKNRSSLLNRIKQIKELPPQDIIFDLTDSTLTLLQIIFSNAKLKIGYPYRGIRRAFYDIATLRSDFVIEAESTQHMLNILGSKNLTPLQYGFEKKYPKDLKNRIIYFAGASTANKCWETSKFTALINKLSSEYLDYEHVILQGIKDDEKFQDIYQPLKDKKNVLIQEPMELDVVMQYLSDAKCVISNDTGIRNMAIAVETPTVGIFFATGAYRYWPRDGKNVCVFNNDYLSPSIQDVWDETKHLLTKLYS